MSKRMNRRVFTNTGLLKGLFKDLKNMESATLLERLDQEYTFPGVFGDVKKVQNSRAISIPLLPARIFNGALNFQVY